MAAFSHPVGLDVFDDLDPIDPGLLADCVHCGFCLPYCPTYLVFSDEMDSPRGRIYLMGELANGAQVSEKATMHLDRCLGCLACVSACPSGVDYESLLQSTRAQLERHGVRSAKQRLTRSGIFALFPYRDRLRVVYAGLRAIDLAGLGRVLRGQRLAERVPRSIATALAVAPATAKRSVILPLSPARSATRGRVSLLLGCVQDTFFSKVNRATVEVLTAEGFDVLAPSSQGCCGALSAHAGRIDEARDFARAVIDTFEESGTERVVVNSAGCGSAMKHYGHLLKSDTIYASRAERFSSRVVDIMEFLASTEPVAPRHPLDLRVAYHDACHLCHGQGIRAEPREVLRQIPGLEVVDLTDKEACCGSAGIYNLVEPETASKLGANKADAVLATGASLAISGNPGCNLQITSALRTRGETLPVAHTIEVLAASIADQTSSTLLGESPSRSARVAPRLLRNLGEGRPRS
ncbi:MAG TPA: heterodisulfide reductase-related iron-sulfur binding cluster [Acidimicrobiales bacterium]